MTDSDSVHLSEIDNRVGQVLGNADEVGLSLVSEILHESRNKWYGRLVVNVYDSLTSCQDFNSVLPAATAIELLRGYVRLRSRLLVTLTDTHAHSLTMNPTSALLAGDYLYSAAVSSLRPVPATRSNDGFEILVSTLETMTETLASTYMPASSTDLDRVVFLDQMAESLGEATAVLGATLAGSDGQNRRYCERLGHGLSSARQIGIVLDAAPSEAVVDPPNLNEAQLLRHAEQRRNDVDQALNALSATVDVTRLRAFAKTTES